MSELVLGREHLRPGGTMIVLLHKIDTWETVQILHEFNQFSSIRLYKTAWFRAIRNSFYLITTNVRSQNKEAIVAIARWKRVWESATFVLDDDLLDMKFDLQGRLDVEQVLEEFGPDLISMGKKVWSGVFKIPR